MTNTRAGAAAVARKAKEKLARVLRRNPDLSHEDFRTSYLQRLQQVHPDKVGNSLQNTTSESPSSVRTSWQRQKDFVELQEAWENYNRLHTSYAKVSAKNYSSNSIDGTTGSFTMFGVGCSFSDNDEERDKRIGFMDQACRGWIAGGQLTPAATSSTVSSKGTAQHVSLINDDMFQERTDEDVADKIKPTKRSETKSLVEK